MANGLQANRNGLHPYVAMAFNLVAMASIQPNSHGLKHRGNNSQKKHKLLGDFLPPAHMCGHRLLRIRVDLKSKVEHTPDEELDEELSVFVL